MIYVDRIEDGIAVLETADNCFVRVPLAELPANVKEGSVLKMQNGGYFLDEEAEKERKRKLLSLQNQLFHKNGG